MYTKGLATATHNILIALSLTGPEMARLARQDTSTENAILDQIGDQITNTENFASEQETPGSFAKAMNQAEGGAIIIVALDDQTVNSLKDQDEQAENTVLALIDSQCRATFASQRKSRRKPADFVPA